MRSMKTTTLLGCALAILASACAGADPMIGSWRDADAIVVLPDGTEVNADATLVLDGAAWDMHLDLSFMTLSDVIEAHGTYVDAGSELELTFTGFTIDPESGNTQRIDESGRHCITQMGFGGAEVCFPSPQANGYTLDGDALAITIDQAIITPDVTQTPLALERVQ